MPLFPGELGPDVADDDDGGYMKKSVWFFVFCCCLIPFTVIAQPDITQHPDCPLCGMDRDKFAHSRMLIVYDDGSEMGACSIRCAAVDLVNNLDKAPAALMVGDYATRELIDAETAVWLIGGARPGVMSARAKWAFADAETAQQFIAEHGGEPATFEEALQAAYSDLYQDTLMIRERRKARRMKMQEAAPQAPAPQSQHQGH